VLDAEGDVLEQDGLAGLRRRDDQPARPEADRAEHVDQAARGRAAPVLERDARLRVERGELREGLALAVLLGGHSLDGDEAAGHHAPLARAARLALLDLHDDRGARRDAVLVHELGKDERIGLALDEAIRKLPDSTLGRPLHRLEDPADHCHVMFLAPDRPMRKHLR
jgi:hypothetical protein